MNRRQFIAGSAAAIGAAAVAPTPTPTMAAPAIDKVLVYSDGVNWWTAGVANPLTGCGARPEFSKDYGVRGVWSVGRDAKRVMVTHIESNRGGQNENAA